jgi:hypothetical protein
MRPGETKKALGMAALVWGGMFLFFWLVGYTPRIKGPSTGETCVELVNRLFAQRDYRRPTPAEERDMNLCGSP